jgi:hypothetical protein
MVTDFLQGIFCNITVLVIILYLLTTFGWDRIGETLLAAPEGKSMIDPLGIGAESQFNAFYWLISAFILFYTMRAWQGDQGYNAAAITPHEAKMATVLSGWRWGDGAGWYVAIRDAFNAVERRLKAVAGKQRRNHRHAKKLGETLSVLSVGEAEAEA